MFKITANKDFLVKSCQLLSWLTAVCRGPEEGDVRASTAVFEQRGKTSRIHNKALVPIPSGNASCWLRMFQGYVLVQGFPVPKRTYARGLELPLDIMAIQAMAFHPINYWNGFFLKGSHTALVPTGIYGEESSDGAQEVQWHFIGTKPRLVEAGLDDQAKREGYYLTEKTLVTDSVPLSWDEIEKYCNTPVALDGLDSLSNKRIFVGSFPRAKNHLGTKGSGYDTIQHSNAPDIPKGTGLEWERAVTFGVTSNFASSGVFGMNASTKVSLPKYDPTTYLPQALVGDKLRNSTHKPHLLYDVAMKSSWLVPESSLVLHLMLSWASVQEPPPHDKDRKVMQFMPFADAALDGGHAASQAIYSKANDALPEYCRRSDEQDKKLTVWNIALMIFMALDCLKEHQQLLQRRLGGWKTYLQGFEFMHVANMTTKKAKRIGIDEKQSGGWIKIIEKPPEIVVLFCNQLGEPLKYEAGQQICQAWQKMPSGYDFLTADSSCLRYLSDTSGKSEHIKAAEKLFLVKASKRPEKSDSQFCKKKPWPCCNPALRLKSHAPTTAIQIGEGEAVVIGNAVPRSFTPWWQSGDNPVEKYEAYTGIKHPSSTPEEASQPPEHFLPIPVDSTHQSTTSKSDESLGSSSRPRVSDNGTDTCFQDPSIQDRDHPDSGINDEDSWWAPLSKHAKGKARMDELDSTEAWQEELSLRAKDGDALSNVHLAGR